MLSTLWHQKLHRSTKLKHYCLTVLSVLTIHYHLSHGLLLPRTCKLYPHVQNYMQNFWLQCHKSKIKLCLSDTVTPAMYSGINCKSVSSDVAEKFQKKTQSEIHVCHI